jgi:hypothetical protein
MAELLIVGAIATLLSLPTGIALGWYFKDDSWRTPRCAALDSVCICDLLGQPRRVETVRCDGKEGHEGPHFSNQYSTPYHWEKTP